jgi:hypothetical protein
MEALAELPNDVFQIVYVLLYDLRPVLVRLLGLLRFFAQVRFCWFVHEAIVSQLSLRPLTQINGHGATTRSTLWSDRT